MPKTIATLLLIFVAITASAGETPASIALLVNEADAAAVAARVASALAATDAVTRAAASRVALVRGLTDVLPQIRDALAVESDSSAAREEVRALIVLGDPAGVDRARAATRKFAPGIDDVIARAVARRTDAFDIYVSVLRGNGFIPDASFFTQALWRRPSAAVAGGSRLLGMRDAAGWTALLAAVRDAHLAMQPDVLVASLNMPSEEIRTASVWYLVHAYVPDPTMIAPRVRTVLGAPTEEGSTREAFGRELLRRMLGGEKKDDPRWLEWLQTSEADPLLATDDALFQHFTDKEFLVRKNHCGITSYDCRMPERRPYAHVIPSTDVAEPAYFLPDLLPPGVAAAVVAETRCNGFWLALAGATADLSGRMQAVTVKRIQMDTACEKAVTTLIRLSLATPASLDVPLEASNVVLVHGFRQPPCLDEGPLEASNGAPRDVGGDVTAPIVKRRVEPQFPLDARRRMTGNAMVSVVLQCIISRDGCVRAVHLVRQSPYPDMNGAALMAISQWTFEPGRLRGVPVDVVFLLTVSFMRN